MHVEQSRSRPQTLTITLSYGVDTYIPDVQPTTVKISHLQPGIEFPIMSSSDLDAVRSQFPALAGDQVFFDNAGGSQTLGSVIEA